MQIFKQCVACIILLTLIGIVTIPVFAATISTGTGDKTTLELTTNSPEKLVFINTIGDIRTEKMKHGQDDYTRLVIPTYTRNTTIGIPELPVKRQLIEIPYNAQVQITVLSFEVNEFNLAETGMAHLLYPVQASQSK